MDGQRRGVVDEESSVLDEEEASVNVYNIQLISFFLFFSFKKTKPMHKKPIFQFKPCVLVDGVYFRQPGRAVLAPQPRGSLAGELLCWQADGGSFRSKQGKKSCRCEAANQQLHTSFDGVSYMKLTPSVNYSDRNSDFLLIFVYL